MLPIRDHNPSARKAYVTWSLIAINIAVFLGSLSILEDDEATYYFFSVFGMVPALLVEGEGLMGLFSSMFLHAGWAHLLGNMLFLWIFGDNLEDAFGHLRFLLFYIACGVAAALIQFIADPFSLIPMVGASGAIAGVMGAYLLLYPRARVDIFFFFIIIFRIVPVPAWLTLIVWFGIQVLGGLSVEGDEGGIAYWAHAGGYLAGFVLALPYWLRRGGPKMWRKTHGVPPHPEAPAFSPSSIPRVIRRR